MKGCAASSHAKGKACVLRFGLPSMFSASGFMVISSHLNPDITLLSLALRMSWIAADCHFALQYNRVSVSKSKAVIGDKCV